MATPGGRWGRYGRSEPAGRYSSRALRSQQCYEFSQPTMRCRPMGIPRVDRHNASHPDLITQDCSEGPEPAAGSTTEGHREERGPEGRDRETVSRLESLVWLAPTETAAAGKFREYPQRNAGPRMDTASGSRAIRNRRKDTGRLREVTGNPPPDAGPTDGHGTGSRAHRRHRTEPAGTRKLQGIPRRMRDHGTDTEAQHHCALRSARRDDGRDNG